MQQLRRHTSRDEVTNMDYSDSKKTLETSRFGIGAERRMKGSQSLQNLNAVGGGLGSFRKSKT
jgi:hypothetical protein